MRNPYYNQKEKEKYVLLINLIILENNICFHQNEGMRIKSVTLTIIFSQF